MILKQLIWIGSSRSDLKDLPSGVQDSIGYALYQAQLGCFPDGAKPLKGFKDVSRLLRILTKMHIVQFMRRN
mgnify:CR=1 FL=1